jgi:hypothetical protein
MTGAGSDDENFGAGRGSGTVSDGKGEASPREAPSEAHAASAKQAIRVTTNPRNRPDMPLSNQYQLPPRRNRKPHAMVDLQQRKKYGTDWQIAQNPAAVVI